MTVTVVFINVFIFLNTFLKNWNQSKQWMGDAYTVKVCHHIKRQSTNQTQDHIYWPLAKTVVLATISNHQEQTSDLLDVSDED